MNLRLLFIFFFCGCISLKAQEKTSVTHYLDSLAVRYPNLHNQVEINVQGLELSEFINGISQSQNLNIGISPKIQGTIDQTFANVKVVDILLFLIQEYKLKIKVIGDIIYLLPEDIPEPEIVDEYAFITLTSQNQINIDVENKKVSEIIRGISKKVKANIILSPQANNKSIALFLNNIDLTSLLNKITLLSDNVLEKDSLSSVFYINKKESESIQDNNPKNRRRINGNDKANYNEFIFEANEGLISVNANEENIQNIIQTIAKDLNINFIFLDNIGNQKVTLNFEGIDFDQFLSHILSGTKFKFIKTDNVYIIGANEQLQFNTTKFFKFQNRTYENVLSSIPNDLKKDLQISEFSELNGLIINGNIQLINNLVVFLKEIDQRVPMVTIDLLIVDYNTSRTVSTGINMGFGSAGDNVRSEGVLSPGVDMKLNSGSLNKILASFEKIGLFNLGSVTPDFYFNLKLLESQGVLKTRSTPKITTLNGQEATLSLGEMEYYLEIKNDIIGTQNPTVSSSQNYRSVNADLSIKIKPVISSDGQVTLEVSVSQSDFTNRINATAPPGKVSRNFESIVRVGNDEMVILGGLEDVTTDRTGSGLPLLNRIPIIKYFFSNREDNFKKSKLNIFIKPTIYY